jgi:hypothetical protein
LVNEFNLSAIFKFLDHSSSRMFVAPQARPWRPVRRGVWNR